LSYRIPFNRQCVLGPELDYVRQAISSGRTCGDGPFTKRSQEIIQQRFGANRALLTTSCTSALEIAGLLCDLKAGDEVILPSYTFVSTANAIVLRGATPVFVDIRPDTLNMDERLIEAAITPRTRAIWPVHYAGVACAMDEIMAIAGRHGLVVVEDAAQGVNSSYKGQWLGTIGDVGCFSFHETKNFSCGEGGALLVNRAQLEKRAEILREKGTNRSQFLRGQIDKYTWVDIGSSYVPSDILAAFLLGQLEGMTAITAKRRHIVETYYRLLQPLQDDGHIRLPIVPPDCSTNYHMFHVLVANVEERTALIAHLKQAAIQATFHYVPLHTSPVGRSLGGRDGMLPVTEDIAGRLLRLPLYYDMSEQDIVDVAKEIERFFLAVRC
jgi:dTDP-4-amino-4,6-dideoxygalactose transaminase